MGDEVGIPAPGELLRDFVNTYEPQVDEESLTSADALTRWFTERRLLGGGASLELADLRAAIAFREGLREVFRAHAGHAIDPVVLQRCERVLSDIPARLSLAEGGPRLVAVNERPFDGAMAGLAEAIRRCVGDRIWTRLKACDRDTCRWVYYDASRNQARRWCSMAGCGNFVKMRRAHATRREGGSPSAV